VIRSIISALKGSYMADETGVPELDTASKAAYNMGALQDKIDQANDYYSKVMSQITKLKDKNMAEIMTPGMIMGQGGGDGGMFGGGGLIGGLILGSLLRNNGNLLGGDGAGGAALGATLRNPPEQNQANMDLMAAIGAVDKSVAISTATMEASQATQTLGITTQLNNVASSIASRVDNVKDVVNTNAVALMQGQAAINQNIMENRYELSKDISNDECNVRRRIRRIYVNV
jgi:hypothetical protein